MKPSKSRFILTIGDSLSDRGTFYNRYLLGLYPMKKLGGLQDKSPYGRYTNGFVWSDYLSAMIANEFIIKDLKEKHHMDTTDIADAVINQSLPKEYSPKTAYTLNNDKAVTYQGHNILRSYNEAGLTAHDYHWIPSTNAKLFLRRNLVSTLGHMRKKLIEDDIKQAVTAEQKAQTLVLDWSGANDLLVANERPTHDIVDKAIQARIKNIEELIKQGYRKFVLFNLPDLFLTPRYKKRSEEELNNAHECSVYFNLKLTEVCQKLAELHKEDCSIEEFNVNELFVEGAEHPEKYGLDPAKTNMPYIKSKHYETKEPKGYTFWDDLHFTAHIHALMGERFFNKIAQDFDFTPPEHATKQPKTTFSNGQLVAGVLGTAAAVVGLNQLGVSTKTTAAVGIGLITLGMFAPRPRLTFFSKAETTVPAFHNQAA